MTKFEKLIKKSIIIDGKVTIGSILGLVDKLVDGCKDDPDIEIDNLKIHFANEDDFKRKKSESPSGVWKICIELKSEKKSYSLFIYGEKDEIYEMITYRGSVTDLREALKLGIEPIRLVYLDSNYPKIIIEDDE